MEEVVSIYPAGWGVRELSVIWPEFLQLSSALLTSSVPDCLAYSDTLREHRQLFATLVEALRG